MPDIIDRMQFTIYDKYYPESKVTWDITNAILYIELFTERSRPSVSVAIEADNITQLCFDLSANHEVMYLECVGFRFDPDDNLIAPSSDRQGNLVLSNPITRCGDEYQRIDDAIFATHYLNRNLELTSSKGSTLLRIGIDTKVITDVLAASPHLLYTLSEGALQEIWIVDPKQPL